MAKITIEVGQGDDDFTVMRDGEVFALREGESIVLVGEDMMIVDGGGAPITIMHFLYPEEAEPDAGEAANDSEPPAHAETRKVG